MLGVDIGGTFTDFVWALEGRIIVYKLPTSTYPAGAFLQGILNLQVPADEETVHGCTVATNALLEGRGGRTALVATRGFKDIIEIGRQTRPSLYQLHVVRPAPLVPRELRFEVDERVTSEGEVLTLLDSAEVVDVARRVKATGAAAAAVSLLFSFLHPQHEEELGRALAEQGLFVSLSSRVLPEQREYERTSTTVVNAYVAPPLQRYLGRLRDDLSQPLRIMQSSGGSLTVEGALEQPVRTLLSGPAGGVAGAFAVGKTAGFDHIITFDMGGTSTDVALCPGRIQETAESVVAGYPIRVPTVDIHTVGAGGGSIARLDAGGALHVGPQSAGASPGPVCYGVGTELTVTDAHLALGRLPADYPLAGRLPIDAERTLPFLRDLARQMGTEVRTAAAGILRVTNATMERAIRRVSVERGHDPREFTLVAYGGAGPLHACDLATSLGIRRVLVPRYPGVLSALGMVLSDVVLDYSRACLLTGMALDDATLGRLFEPLEKEGLDALKGTPFLREIQLERSLDLRYRGQSYEITVPVAPGEGPKATTWFHQAHHQRYGHSHPEAATEVVALRLKARGLVQTPELERLPWRGGDPSASLIDRRPVFWEGRLLETPLHRRDGLQPGNRVSGPALLTQMNATTLVAPGWRGEVAPHLNLVLEPAS